MMKIKIFVDYCLSFIYTILFYFIPINNKKVIFWSYFGSQYSCSPKSIFEKLDDDYSVIWAFTNPENFTIGKKAKKVKINSFIYMFHVMTSKYIITNCRTVNRWFPKKTKQIYIQTWHGPIALKKIENDAISSLNKTYIREAKRDSKKINYCISSNEAFSNILKKSFWYSGEILEIGTPRNDIYFNYTMDTVNALKTSLGIDTECKILLYAPTFRNDMGNDIYDIDYELIINAFKKKFFGDIRILVRFHPNLVKKGILPKLSPHIIDVSKFQSMESLLIASDFLLNDYSSSMFDFMLMKKPCFLYMKDYDSYANNERGLYFVREELPFPSALNFDDLILSVNNFNNTDYLKKLNKFIEDINLIEDGDSTNKLIKYVFESNRGGEC